VVEKELLEQIYSDFSIIIQKKEILGILLYGSYLLDNETSKSDIDICIVAPNEDIHQLISFILQNVNVSSKKYDVRVFQELPLYIKIHVIENGKLIYSENELDLYEHFYLYRKLWNDQKHRQEISREELISFLD